jgi:hypothetical protein
MSIACIPFKATAFEDNEGGGILARAAGGETPFNIVLEARA